MLQNTFLTWLPRRMRTTITTTAINTRIRAYSTIPCPSSRLNRARRRRYRLVNMDFTSRLRDVIQSGAVAAKAVKSRDEDCVGLVTVRKKGHAVYAYFRTSRPKHLAPEIYAGILFRRPAHHVAEKRKGLCLVGHRADDDRLRVPATKVGAHLRTNRVGEDGRLLAHLDGGHDIAGDSNRSRKGGTGEDRIRLRHAKPHVRGCLPDHCRALRHPRIRQHESDAPLGNRLHLRSSEKARNLNGLHWHRQSWHEANQTRADQ